MRCSTVMNDDTRPDSSSNLAPARCARSQSLRTLARGGSRKLRVGCAWALLACSLGLPARLLAQADSAAPAGQTEYDALIDRALAEFEAAHYLDARALFEEAHALQPSARTLRGLGLTAFQQRDYDTAQQELQAAMRSSLRPLTPVQRVEVGELLAWMETGLSTLQLQVSPPHAVAEIDDRPRPAGRLLLDPGEHRLHVHAEGHQPERRSFTLDLGQALSLHVRLVPLEAAGTPPPLTAASDPPNPPASRAGAAALTRPRDAEESPKSASIFSRWWFWTALGVVVVGGVVSAVALTRESDAPYERGGVDGVVRTLHVEPGLR